MKHAYTAVKKTIGEVNNPINHKCIFRGLNKMKTENALCFDVLM